LENTATDKSAQHWILFLPK